MAVQLGSIQHTAPCFKLANTAIHVLQQIDECDGVQTPQLHLK